MADILPIGAKAADFTLRVTPTRRFHCMNSLDAGSSWPSTRPTGAPCVATR
jgi:hypothetical protein